MGTAPLRLALPRSTHPRPEAEKTRIVTARADKIGAYQLEFRLGKWYRQSSVAMGTVPLRPALPCTTLPQPEVEKTNRDNWGRGDQGVTFEVGVGEVTPAVVGRDGDNAPTTGAAVRHPPRSIKLKTKEEETIEMEVGGVMPAVAVAMGTTPLRPALLFFTRSFHQAEDQRGSDNRTLGWGEW